jgi:hypothetical protein
MPRRPGSDLTQVEDLTPAESPDAIEERTGPTPIDRTGNAVPRRLGLSVPGAVGGALLVCALAFGADLGSGGFFDSRDTSAGMAATAACDGGDCDPGGDGQFSEPPATGAPDGTAALETVDGDSDEVAPTEKPEPKATEKPEPKATEKPEPEKTAKPEPKATEKPEPKATEKPVLGLELAIKEGAVLIDWSACELDGADYYKVVRSSDPTVKWPSGDNDEVVTAVEVGGTTKAWDKHAPAGKKAWYRVFCVRHTDDGYKVLTSSEARSIKTPETPEPTPKPEPSDMWIEAGADGGAIVLHWEACGGEDFSHYRILRKAEGEPTVIAEIEDAGTTTYADDDVEPGVEYHYLVQSKGHTGDGFVLLGTTGWVGATVE